MSETKKCTKCQRELPLDSFRWKNKAEGRKHAQCKECQRAQEKQHYQESRERRESVRMTADCQRITNIRLVDEARQVGCKKCGDEDSLVIYCCF